MKIKNKSVVVYDIEIFPNVFSCTCKNTETEELRTFEISERKNDLFELIKLFSNKEIMFCGYNNHHYDDVVINYIIDYFYVLRNKFYLNICKSLFNLSKTIISSEDGDIKKFKRWKYAKFFYSMDVLTMLFSSKKRMGLKEMQLTMHYKNIQEYDGNFDAWLPSTEIDKMIEYNINDVESTIALLYKLQDDIDLRLFIEEEYGLDVLSFDKTKIGEKILEKKYCDAMHISSAELKGQGSPMDYIPLKDVILPFIQYKNPKLQALLEDMKKQIVYSKERKGYEKKFVLSNTVYSVGVGGIHSINTPEILIPKSDEYIGHSDVASMYPSLIIKYKFIPRHLGEIFLQVYSQIYDERIEAKHSGQAKKNDVLKYALNAVTGKMQQEVSWMYDPFTVFKIRINGQLILLMLVDRLLELNCKIVQVNTDGIMYIAQKTKRKLVQDAINEVEQITRLSFESNDYEAFYQYAVNDYFGVIEGYSQSKNPKLIEKKGMFITNTNLGMGLTPTVIPKAVINHFLTGESVKDYITRQTDIRDFLMGQKIDKKFRVRHGNTLLQRINRYYASMDGAYLFKFEKANPDNESNMLTKSGVTVLNKFDDKSIQERKINYRYYISEAQSIVDDFECRQLELF
ncbi:hypothetical protein [Sharpea azabuensis]|uniref:hypothetical protein n=1 Tax=Sharpea azabuensis TaxID=322505 RepID=UPI001568DC5A|nr:hypothetical protein [Sharpea azabuensis]